MSTITKSVLKTKVDKFLEDTNNKCNSNLINSRSEILTNMISTSLDYFEGENYKEFESNCLLLDGKWGSGKSWTLDVLEDLLKDKQINNQNIRYLKYSAWQYLDEKELFYDLFDKLIEDIEQLKNVSTTEIIENGENVKKLEKIWERGFSIFKFFNHNKNLFKKLFYFAIKITLSMIPGGSVISEATSMIPVVKIASNIINRIVDDNPDTIKWIKEMGFDISVLLKYEDEKKEKKNDSEPIISDQRDLNFLMLNKPIIVIIDDLDRCQENKLWRILTLLSLFDRQPNLLFICVGSSEYLIKILEQKYHVKGEGENFLTKFFAKECPLKEISYVDQLVEEFVTESEIAIEDVKKFLNLFVEIKTYREYKIRYLQPLKDMKENGDLNKDDNFETKNKFVIFVVKNYFKLKYKSLHDIMRNDFKMNIKSEPKEDLKKYTKSAENNNFNSNYYGLNPNSYLLLVDLLNDKKIDSKDRNNMNKLFSLMEIIRFGLPNKSTISTSQIFADCNYCNNQSVDLEVANLKSLELFYYFCD